MRVFQMYVTLMFRAKGTRLTKPTLCLVLLSLAVLVGVIRVTEHRNHWNDVLAGFITGGAIAAFLVREREREKETGIWLDRAINLALRRKRQKQTSINKAVFHQVTCVINNFQPTHLAAPTPLPLQHPEAAVGIPLLSLPRVESPLEKLSGLQVRDGDGSGTIQTDMIHQVSFSLSVRLIVFVKTLKCN